MVGSAVGVLYVVGGGVKCRGGMVCTAGVLVRVCMRVVSGVSVRSFVRVGMVLCRRSVWVEKSAGTVRNSTLFLPLKIDTHPFSTFRH